LAGARIDYQTQVLAERRVRATGVSGGAIAEIQRDINVLDQFGRSRELPSVVRTALRIRIMTLVDRLGIEQGKQRFLEGNFAAAQYHFEAARARTWKVRAASVAMRIAPRLVRTVYLRMRPSGWRGPPATPAPPRWRHPRPLEPPRTRERTKQTPYKRIFRAFVPSWRLHSLHAYGGTIRFRTVA